MCVQCVWRSSKVGGTRENHTKDILSQWRHPTPTNQLVNFNLLLILVLVNINMVKSLEMSLFALVPLVDAAAAAVFRFIRFTLICCRLLLFLDSIEFHYWFHFHVISHPVSSALIRSVFLYTKYLFLLLLPSFFSLALSQSRLFAHVKCLKCGQQGILFNHLVFVMISFYLMLSTF